MKRWSIKMLRQAQGKLVGFFGEKKPIGSITVADAADFKRQLASKHSTAYVAKLVLLSRQFFKDAVDREILDRSPFGKLKAGSQKNAARLRFISREVIDRAIQAAPSLEWKLIIALARYGGLRIPSELVVLRWTDIDWDKRRIHIQSSKTAHHVGHESRDIPLFPEIEILLRQARAAAPADTIFVSPSYRDPEKNLRKPFMDILKKAGIAPWPKLFQNLRSTRQTELTELFPAHIVCSWIGISERVANGHCLQVTQEHFDKASGQAAGPHNDRKVGTAGDGGHQNNGWNGKSGEKVGAESGAAGACFASRAIVLPRGENYVSEDAASRCEDLQNCSKSRIYNQMGATGFEPVKAEPADLQAAFCCTKNQEFSHMHGAFVSDYLHGKRIDFVCWTLRVPFIFEHDFSTTREYETIPFVDRAR